MPAVLAGLALFFSALCTNALGEELTKTLEKVKILEAEKTGSSVVTPAIVIEGKTLVDCVVRIHPNEGVSMSIPSSTPNTRSLKRVFADPKTGGLFITDEKHPEAVAAGGSTRYLKIKAPEKTAPLTLVERIENLFIKQMAYLLIQRHKDDPITSKFFDWYFPIQEEESAFDLGKGAPKFVIGEDPKTKLFHFMEKPSDWEGQACTDTECRFVNPNLGELVLPHPGAADLVVSPEELAETSELHQPLAPEVQDASELEAQLSQLPADVETVYFLISHKNCAPCQAIKRNDREVQGLWTKFCRKIKKSKRLAALMENASMEPKALSPIMTKYGCVLTYPQILIFHRDQNGAWEAPQVVPFQKFEEILR